MDATGLNDSRSATSTLATASSANHSAAVDAAFMVATCISRTKSSGKGNFSLRGNSIFTGNDAFDYNLQQYSQYHRCRLSHHRLLRLFKLCPGDVLRSCLLRLVLRHLLRLCLVRLLLMHLLKMLLLRLPRRLDSITLSHSSPGSHFHTCSLRCSLHPAHQRHCQNGQLRLHRRNQRRRIRSSNRRRKMKIWLWIHSILCSQPILRYYLLMNINKLLLRILKLAGHAVGHTMKCPKHLLSHIMTLVLIRHVNLDKRNLPFLIHPPSRRSWTTLKRRPPTTHYTCPCGEQFATDAHSLMMIAIWCSPLPLITSVLHQHTGQGYRFIRARDSLQSSGMTHKLWMLHIGCVTVFPTSLLRLALCSCPTWMSGT